MDTEIRNLEICFKEQIRNIIVNNLSKMPNYVNNFDISSEYEDTKLSFDFKFKQEIQISCRLRDYKYINFRDITIRSRSKNGGTTELSKLISGKGQIYFYGYIKGNKIIKWLLIDIDKIRHLLANNGKYGYNYDGTAFKAYSYSFLKKNNAVIAYWKEPEF